MQYFERLASHALAASSAGGRAASQRAWGPSGRGATHPHQHRALTLASAKPQNSTDTAGNTLTWVLPENRQQVQRVLEVAERAARSWEPTLTDFLSPAAAADAMAALTGRSDVHVVPWGGYSQAERCRLVCGPEEVLAAFREDPVANSASAVAALEVRGNFMFDPATHPDFLGAILGTGVVRERVGDILVQGETGAQILVDPQLVEHFEMSLTQVRTVPVKTMCIPLSQLLVAAPTTQEITSVEASMRLDAVASAGFRLSRSKVVALVESGDVRVNWRPVTRPATVLKAGDVVSMTGKGRLTIQDVNTTKRDKFAVTMLRST